MIQNFSRNFKHLTSESVSSVWEQVAFLRVAQPCIPGHESDKGQAEAWAAQPRRGDFIQLPARPGNDTYYMFIVLYTSKSREWENTIIQCRRARSWLSRSRFLKSENSFRKLFWDLVITRCTQYNFSPKPLELVSNISNIDKLLPKFEKTF